MVERGVIEILPFTELEVELSPRVARGRRGGSVTVRAANTGNVPASLGLAGSDPENTLGFRFTPPTLHLQPGAVALASVVVSAGGSVLFGSRQARPFQVVVSPDGQPKRTLDGMIQQVALLPAWTLAGLALAAIGFGALLMAHPFGPQPPTPTLSPVASTMVAEGTPNPTPVPSAGPSSNPIPSPESPSPPPAQVPPKPTNARSDVVSVTDNPDGSTTTIVRIRWDEPADSATGIRVYGVTTCLNASKATDGKPCIVEHMRLPDGSLLTVATAQGSDRSVDVEGIATQACPGTLRCGDYYAYLLGAFNSAGQSVLAIVESATICWQCSQPTSPSIPTPTSRPPRVIVGQYVCLDVGVAIAQSTSDGLVITWQGGAMPGATEFVSAQNPAAGSSVAPGTSILLAAQPDKPASCP